MLSSQTAANVDPFDANSVRFDLPVDASIFL